MLLVVAIALVVADWLIVDDDSVPPAALAPEPASPRPERPERPAPSRWLLLLAGAAVLTGSALVFRLVRR